MAPAGCSGGKAAIATVRYRITIHQTMHHEGNEVLPGLKDYNGRLDVLDGEHDLVSGDEMILLMKGGRKARFFADSGSAPPGRAHIHVNEIS